MRSNFAQPAGGDHAGVFPHAYSPTDEELTARARGWLANGGVLVRCAYADPDCFEGGGVCWHVRTAGGVTLEGLPGRIAAALLDEGNLAQTEQGATVTLYRVRAG